MDEPIEVEKVAEVIRCLVTSARGRLAYAYVEGHRAASESVQAVKKSSAAGKRRSTSAYDAHGPRTQRDCIDGYVLRGVSDIPSRDDQWNEFSDLAVARNFDGESSSRGVRIAACDRARCRCGQCLKKRVGTSLIDGDCDSTAVRARDRIRALECERLCDHYLSRLSLVTRIKNAKRLSLRSEEKEADCQNCYYC